MTRKKNEKSCAAAIYANHAARIIGGGVSDGVGPRCGPPGATKSWLLVGRAKLPESLGDVYTSDVIAGGWPGILEP